jgi:hypothetical protein
VKAVSVVMDGKRDHERESRRADSCNNNRSNARSKHSGRAMIRTLFLSPRGIKSGVNRPANYPVRTFIFTEGDRRSGYWPLRIRWTAIDPPSTRKSVPVT